uniref:Uncharacterized protein n=1 Tax=Rhizophora mucronata TaxID=61149 RepID=A0A2P2Q200_RHIMU
MKIKSQYMCVQLQES